MTERYDTIISGRRVLGLDAYPRGHTNGSSQGMANARPVSPLAEG